MAKRENIGKSEIQISVELDKKLWTIAQKKSFDALAQNLELKGFRKGKIPANIAKKNISQQQIWQHAINANIEKMGLEAREQTKPDDKIIAGPFYQIKAITEDMLLVIFTYVLYPQIQITNYKGLDIKYIEPKVTSDDVNLELKKIQERLSIWNIVKEPIKKGLKVKFDFEGFINDKPFSGGKAENYELIIGSGRFIPGFEEGMLGMKTGDEKDIKVVFPKKYHDKKMAGKNAKFSVKIHEIFKKSIPTLNDTLAIESNIPNIKTLVELKEFIKKAISNAKMVSSKATFQNKAFKLIKKDVDLVIPEVLINQEVQRLVKQFEENIKRQNISIKDYLKANNMDSKDVIEKFKVEAKVRLLDTFIFAEIAGKEKFKITDAEYENQYKSVANMYKQDIDTVKKSIPKQQLQIQLMNDKVIDFLIKNRKK